MNIVRFRVRDEENGSAYLQYESDALWKSGALSHL